MKKIVFLLFIITVCAAIINKKREIIIPKEAFRIRVVANSNSLNDQKIKSDIKKEVTSYLKPLVFYSTDYSDVEKNISNNIENIKFIIEKYTTDYSISIGKNYFPEKEYKNIKYDEGYYNSLVILLGEAKGNNFWCVLFPPLCYIDEKNLSNASYSFYISKLLNKIN